MPTFRCNACQALTDDLDNPRCTAKCKGFNPTKIIQMHVTYTDDGVRKLYCTDETPPPSVFMSPSIHACTCVDCIDVYVKRYNTSKEVKKELPEPTVPSSFQEPMEADESELG